MAVPYHNYLLTAFEERDARKLQRLQIRDVCDPFRLPNSEFQKLFRINKDMGLYLVEKLHTDLEPHSIGGISCHIKILSSIQFLANGGYQRQLGQDHSLCSAQTTISKFLSQFVEAVYVRLMSTCVNFPATETDRRSVAVGFEEKFGVPNVLGALDCTHVTIFPPPGPEGAQFKSMRKDLPSINVQLIADSDCRILSVNARYPGRVHDSFIRHHSNIKSEMKRLYDCGIGSYFLLGDSGYPTEPWLLTPILDAEPHSPEHKYTQWHCKTRNVIERTNGYLKGSLRCIGIDRVLHYSPEKSSKIIYACCIVYNIMKHFGVPLEEEMVESDRGVPAEDNHEDYQEATLFVAGQTRRNQIIRTYFS